MSNKTKWEIGTTFSGKIGIWDPNGTGKTICYLPGYDEDKKNAAIISAAPEMLELLEDSVKKLSAGYLSSPKQKQEIDQLKNSINILLTKIRKS